MNRPWHPFLHSFRFWIICSILVLGIHTGTQSQTFYSRDNNVGISSYASSWQGQAPIMSNETIVENQSVVVKGYLSHGTDLSKSNITFTGVDASLLVEDTLRIHGGLNMKAGSSIHIKPGGVLIVQMAYYQESNVTFKNEGKAVFLDSWQTTDNPSSISNSGSMYVAGAVAAGGSGITIKPYSSLPADYPSLYEFSRTNVIKAECTGSNSGTVTFSESGATIIRWEMSTDFFRTKTNISNTSTSQLFRNLTKTTSYRAYYRTSSGVEKYSPGSTFVVLGQAKGGSISGTTEVCGDFNNASLHLQNYYGEIVQWESSTDNFTTTTKTRTNSEFFSISNVSQSTQYRVLVESSKCSQAYSSTFYLKHFNYSKGGTLILEGAGKVCKGDNSGLLTLTDFTGSVVRWESSTSENFSTKQVINSTASQLNFSNLETTTYYRVVVKSGPCSEALSNTAGIEVAEIMGGTLTGATAVCSGSNSGTISLSGFKGNILRWESSTDGFATIQTISNTTNQLTYQNLNKTTRYRAVVGNGGICPEATSTVAEISTTDDIYTGLDASVATVAPSALQLSFPFNGNANDVSGNGNHGILYGPTLTEGHYGLKDRAYYFNGSSYIATTKKFLAPGPNVFTLSIWFKTTSTTGGKLIGYGNAQTGTSTHFDRNIYMTDNGQLYYGVFLSRVNNVNQYGIIKTTASYNDGQWHHVAVSMSANGAKMYVDGALKAQDPSITTGENFAGYWKIGFDDLGQWPEQPSSLLFKGSLDEVRIYDKELSAEEIYHLSSVGVAPSCEGESISLFAETLSGTSFQWSGPGGFSSVEQNPVIRDASTAHAGIYTLTYSKNDCSFQRSTEVTITPASYGGTLTGGTSVCPGKNSGTITVSGHIGEILRWESSADADFSTVSTLNSTTSEFSYLNLSATTYFRAVVKNSPCGEAFSTIAIIEVSEVEGGTLTGPATVCENGNSGTIRLSGHKGNVVRWESSTNNFETIQLIPNTTEELSFENLTQSTSYRAVVGKGDICAEATSSSIQIEVAPMVKGGKVVPSQSQVCSGENSGSLSLQNYVGEIIRWESSTDNFATSTPLNNTTSSHTFENLSTTTSFRAVVQSGACGEEASLAATIEVETSSKGGTIGANVQKICEGLNSGILTLENYVGEIIRWESSTDGFANDLQEIAHSSATLSFENLTQTTSYRALVQSGSCSAAYSFPITIEVLPLSQGGSLSGSAQVCKGDNSGTLRLSGQTGEVIRWESSADADFSSVSTLNSTTSEFSYLNLTTTTYFRAVVKNGPCGEAFSSTATIVVSEVAGGTLSGSEEFCSPVNAGTLVLSGHTGNIIRWESSTDGFVNDVKTISNRTTELVYNNITTNTSFRAVVENGPCTAIYSEPAAILIIPPSSGGTLTSASTVVCPGAKIEALYLQDYVGQIVRWERSNDGFENHLEIIQHTQSELSYSNLQETSSFRVVVQSGNCNEALSSTYTIKVEVPALGGVVEGGKRVKAGVNEGELEVKGYDGNILYWESSTDQFVGAIQKISHTRPTLNYKDVPADTWFRAAVQKGTCDPVYSQPALISVNQAPVAVADTFLVEPGKVFYSDRGLLENDYDPNQDQITLQAGQNFLTAEGNALQIASTGTIIFSPQLGFAGTDSFQYQICDLAGDASLCSSGIIVFQVQKGQVLVYQGLSPNQDLKNDHWFIENIEHYPNNLIQLYNPNGILVFEMQGYDNAEKVFSGIGNRGMGSSGQELPDGTYFYYIRLGEAKAELKGYIILNR